MSVVDSDFEPPITLLLPATGRPYHTIYAIVYLSMRELVYACIL